MPTTISIPDDVYLRLEALARPFVDREPADVIRRLVEGASTGPTPSKSTAGTASNNGAAHREALPGPSLEFRAPRERGARVEVNGEVILADSVRDLYEKVLHQIAKKSDDWSRLRTLVPFKTSSRRYLIAEKPAHPNGNAFFVPVQHRGLFMETHKSYRTAVDHLEALLARIGYKVRYLGH
jgi:hypothetical protein